MPRKRIKSFKLTATSKRGTTAIKTFSNQLHVTERSNAFIDTKTNYIGYNHIAFIN